ncbi:serine hydrolase domain-containing protein [Brevibacterium otitidis]|uniref:Serine hydrolase domain-containing protein n=1 Tax=Brevibacterium otitidis TaxID=53364 RepID=A0ABV5X5C7_9MICO
MALRCRIWPQLHAVAIVLTLGFALGTAALPALAGETRTPHGGIAGAERTGGIDAGLARLVSDLDTPGIAVAVVGPDGIVAEQRAGDLAGAPPTALRWGSLSKGITGSRVDALIASGDLRLADMLGEHVPDLPAGYSEITIRQLLTHTSGLSHDVALTDVDRPDTSAREVVSELPVHAPAVRHGSAYEYSSLNYLLLQAVVESVTGEPFGPPAGVPAHGCSLETENGSVPFFGMLIPAGQRCDAAGLGYGYFGGTFDELTDWAAWNLSARGRIFHAHSRAAATPTEADAPASDTRSEAMYGFGWSYDTVDAGGRTWKRIHHSGAVPGAFTRIEILPDDNRAVVLMASGYGEPGSADLPESTQFLSSLLVGGQPVPDSGPAEGAGTPVYPIALGALSVLTAGAGVWLLLQLRGRPRRPVAALAVSAAGSAAILAGLILGVPAVTGLSVVQLGRWAPDIVVLAVASSALTVASAFTALIRWTRMPGQSANASATSSRVRTRDGAASSGSDS